MTCGGCSGAIERVLAKAQREGASTPLPPRPLRKLASSLSRTGAGVDSYTVSLEAQSVDVNGTIAFDELTRRIEKTGKQVRGSSFLSAPLFIINSTQLVFVFVLCNPSFSVQILEANEVGALAADEPAEQVSLAAAPVAVV